MAIGDTRRLLNNLRDSGYFLTRVRDSTGRLAWDVFYPTIHHNFDTDVNEVRNVYIGKVERYGGPQFSIGGWHPYQPFGRPFFYVTHRPAVRAAGYTRNAMQVVRRTPSATLRRQTRV